MNRNEILFIQGQNEDLELFYDELLDELIDDLEYLPPPLNPLRPSPSEDEVREELHTELKSLLMVHAARERCLMGVRIIFEDLAHLSGADVYSQELTRAGELLMAKISPVKEGSDHEGEEDLLFDTPSRLYEKLDMSFDTFKAIYEIGNRLFHEEKYEDAVCVYEVLTLLDNSSSDSWFAAGLCHYRLSRWNEAANCFVMAHTANPTDLRSLTDAAFCYLELKDMEKAKEMIATAEAWLDDANIDPAAKPSYVLTIEKLKELAA